jgi:hypothetical protein
VQPVGFSEFLYGDFPLLAYDFVRQQLRKHLPVRPPTRHRL